MAEIRVNATGELKLYDSDDSNYVSFKSAGTVSSNVAWTLPSADGSSGQMLSTNGSGTLSWATASSADPTSADGDSLGTASAEWSDLFLADGGIIKFGNDQDVLLTHVADTGLLLSGTNVIQFNDASQNIGAPSATVLDINATDEIELNATAIDLNGTLNVSGTTTASTDLNVGNNINLTSDDSVISFGADSEVLLTHANNDGLTLSGGVPNLTIGSGTTENTTIYFDGNQHDFRMGIYDNYDYFEIGYGAGQGRYSGLLLDLNKHVYVQGVVTDSGANLLAGCASMWLRNEQASTLNVSMADDATITPNLAGGSAALIFVGTSGGGSRGALFMASYGSSTIVKLADPTGEFDVAVTDGRIICLTKAINTSVVTCTNKAGSTQSVMIATIANLGL